MWLLDVMQIDQACTDHDSVNRFAAFRTIADKEKVRRRVLVVGGCGGGMGQGGCAGGGGMRLRPCGVKGSPSIHSLG